MAATAEEPGAGDVRRSRRCVLALEDPRASAERLAAYLALLDRPMAALLARDRLERTGPGRFLYRSRPFRLLRLELVPTLEFRADWQAPRLRVVSESCRLVGLGRWERALAFALEAELEPGPQRLEGELRLRLAMAPSLPGWTRALAGRALDEVLQRIERRLRRGLRKDLLMWLLDPAVSG